MELPPLHVYMKLGVKSTRRMKNARLVLFPMRPSCFSTPLMYLCAPFHSFPLFLHFSIPLLSLLSGGPPTPPSAPPALTHLLASLLSARYGAVRGGGVPVNSAGQVMNLQRPPLHPTHPSGALSSPHSGVAGPSAMAIGSMQVLG